MLIANFYSEQNHHEHQHTVLLQQHPIKLTIFDKRETLFNTFRCHSFILRMNLITLVIGGVKQVFRFISTRPGGDLWI